jgi:diamine N-acetyltransferase
MTYLYSKRLRLRAAEREDISQFLKWINDPEVTENLMMYFPVSSTEEIAWYEGMLKHPQAEHIMVVEIKVPSGKETQGDEWFAIGNVEFHDIDWRNRQAEIGIMIGEKDHWDQGYGTEIMQLMLMHGFNTLNLNRIWLRVYEKNLRGRKAYEKAGFITEGRLRQAHFQHGRYYDIIIMSVLRDEWLQSHQQ